ncbi:MAG TPA: hypothetical protein VFU94_15260 [Conexibacter sp.]|nr:hypothetical protein [Conexibacter sp.]
MAGILVSAALVCVAAHTIGQVVIRLCGCATPSWAAPGVGISVVMLLAMPALHLPGRTTTTFVVIALATVACAAACVLRPELRPSPLDVLAALPVAALVLIPFAAAGHGGLLGVSFDNDMGAHLRMAESFRSAAAQRLFEVPGDYPIGPHALVAAMTTGLGIGLDESFTGFTVALPILLGWTALGLVRGARWWGKAVAALLVAAPALLIGYYGQGSFKELAIPLLTLAGLVLLLDRPTSRSLARWIPLGLLIAGALSVYSFGGVAWPLAVVAPWVALAGARALWARGPRGAVAELRTVLLPAAVALGAFVVVIAPQIPRLHKFFTANTSGEVGVSALGNLAGPLRFWQLFGVWNSPDYRIMGASDPLALGVWVGLVAALVLVGVAVSARRGEWLLPLAAALIAVLCVYFDHRQSPYLAAKALAVGSPVVMALAARAVVEQEWLPAGWWRWAGGLVALLLVVKLVSVDVPELRFSKVGPTERMHELRALEPALAGHNTLFLGNDDFLSWELEHVRHSQVVLGVETMPTRPGKAWTYGQALDLDSVDDATLNQFDRFIVPRDAQASVPPPQLRLIRRGANYDVYARVGAVPPRRVLPGEGGASAKPLRCDTALGRAILAGGGTAMIREPAVTADALPPLAPGANATTELTLTPGVWDLQTPYGSEHPVAVTIPGKLHVTLSANLDRPGPRWPIGTIDVTRAGPVRVVLHADKTFLTPASAAAYVGPISAVRRGSARLVPIRAACGRLVDWYEPRTAARGAGQPG